MDIASCPCLEYKQVSVWCVMAQRLRAPKVQPPHYKPIHVDLYHQVISVGTIATLPALKLGHVVWSLVKPLLGFRTFAYSLKPKLLSLSKRNLVKLPSFVATYTIWNARHELSWGSTDQPYLQLQFLFLEVNLQCICVAH